MSTYIVHPSFDFFFKFHPHETDTVVVVAINTVVAAVGIGSSSCHWQSHGMTILVGQQDSKFNLFHLP